LRHHDGQQYHFAARRGFVIVFLKVVRAVSIKNEFSPAEYTQLHCKKAVSARRELTKIVKPRSQRKFIFEPQTLALV
jgi:hypothetical protein